MGSRAIDLIGKRFERWIVIERRENDKNYNSRWLCRCDCGSEKIVIGESLRSGRSKSCGCHKRDQATGRFGKNHFNYRNGKHYDMHGYVLLLANEYPDSIPEGWKHKYIKEHRIVMARHLGRPLKPYENIHHINGNKEDNRLENLELWVTRQPAGQRVQDLVEWAKEILQEYE